MLKSDPKSQGGLARVLKMGKQSNPFEPSTSDHALWLKGYLEEKRAEYISQYDGDHSGYYH